MFIERKEIEKVLNDRGLCSSDQFASRCGNKRWRVGSYIDCINAIFDHYGIVDDRGNETTKLVTFLNGKLPHRELGPKRRHVDWSMAESSEEEEGFGPTTMDISTTSVLSLDENPEVLELKRQLCEAKKENKGTISINLQFYILFSSVREKFGH